MGVILLKKTKTNGVTESIRLSYQPYFFVNQQYFSLTINQSTIISAHILL